MRSLDLVPIYLPRRSDQLSRLAVALEAELLVPVRTRTPWFDPEASYDPARGQYNSTRLLAELLRDPQPPPWRVLGVAGVDLFTPVLTFVFGEAQLDGRAAVVSTHRLRSELYGLGENAPLLDQRLLKESLHELGHTVGLVHCHDPGCVMQVSTYVEDIDIKPARFCRPCLEVMRRVTIS